MQRHRNAHKDESCCSLGGILPHGTPDGVFQDRSAHSGLQWGTLVIMALMKLFLGLDSLMTTQSVMALLGMPCSSNKMNEMTFDGHT